MIVSKTKEVAKSENEYPKLMIVESSGLIILFTEENDGIVVSPNNIHKIGYSTTRWVMDDFRDFNGEITLKNK